MVNVYEDETVVGRVKYNSNLDYRDGHNWTCGSVGRHKGLTVLKNGKYVLIYGTQWQGEKDYGEVITANKALQEVLKSGNDDLLEESRFKELLAIYKGLEQEVCI